MRAILSFCALFLTLAFNASAACEASFTYTISGNTVTFVGHSNISPVSYTWHFGDQTSATGQTVTHTFAQFPEHFNVCLLIQEDNNGCSDEVCQSVYVQSGPINCEAAMTYNISEGNQVHFFATSNMPNPTYTWMFGDGTTATGNDPWHTYSVYPEHYQVCLIATSTAGNCVDTVCQTVYVQTGPQCQAAFTYTIENNTVSFVGSPNSSGITYHWDFGDGHDGSGEHPTHTYLQYPEHYDVCLITHNNNTGCVDTVCQNIYVQSGPPSCQAAMTYTVSGNQVHFFGTSNVPGATYTWLYGDGSTGTGNDPWHTYTQYPEHYTACLIISNPNNCLDTVCETVYVQTGPTNCVGTFTYTTSGNEVSFHGASNIPGVTYSWSFGDGSSGTGENIGHTYAVYPEHYQVCLTIYNSNGCQYTTCQSVYVQTGPQQCEGSFTYTINDNVVSFHGESNVNGVYYHWLFGDNSNGIGQNISHTYANYPEHYNVCMVISNPNTNCLDTVCQNIYVQHGPNQACEAAFTYEVVNNTVVFHGTSNTNNVDYKWLFGDGTTQIGQNATHTYGQYPEHYNVCLVIWNNSINCRDTICQTVYVQHGPPQNCEGAFTYIIQGNSVHFIGTSNVPGASYYWDFGDTGTASGNSDPWHTYTVSPEHYDVCMYIYNNDGCADTVCQNIYIPNSGSGNDCQAAFTYTVDQNEVHFHGTSTENNVDYHWLFGDGHNGYGQSPTHVYTEFPEHYTVCLIVHNNNLDCIDTVCQTIYIQGGGSGSNCQANFTYSINDNVVTFAGTSTEPNVDYIWQFGDTHNGTGQTVTHSYSHFPEHYTVCLIVRNNNIGCADTVCQTIYVQHGQACNSEFTYTITGNEVHFHGPSNSSGTTYQWTFGDGGTSDNHNPNHHYTQAPEHYNVCLTVTGPNNCSSTTCHNIYIQSTNTQQYELSGTIYGGQNTTDEGTVYLIHYDANLGSLQAVATTAIGANGHYAFHVQAGNYFVKAALSSNSAYYAHRLPTYYTHDLFWNSATVISLNTNLNQRNINLIEGINQGGPGFIGGLVTQGANKNTGPGDPIEGVEVMLLTMEDEPVQYTYSNANGEFTFTNLAYGTYKVYGEVTNLNTIPAIVTINANNQTVDNVNLWVTDKEVTTGVFEQTVLNNAGVGQLYPNPTNGDAAFNITVAKDVDLNIRVYDITGREVYNTNISLGSGINLVDLPTSTLVSGVYSIVLFEAKANSTVHRKLVKLN